MGVNLQLLSHSLLIEKSLFCPAKGQFSDLCCRVDESAPEIPVRTIGFYLF